MESGVAMHRRLIRLLPVIIGIIALSILYGQLLLPGRALAERDIPGLHLPMLTDLARVGAEGIPYWNPSIHGGQPLLTNPHYATFYPPTWMIFLLPVDYVIGLLVFLHALWAFVGAWRLARRWGCESAAASLAAVAFVGGGAFVSSPNLLNLFLGMAWLPWILALGRGGPAGASGQTMGPGERQNRSRNRRPGSGGQPDHAACSVCWHSCVWLSNTCRVAGTGSHGWCRSV